MKKSIFEAGLLKCTGSKVSDNEAKGSIRQVAAFVVNELKLETAEQVGKLVDFIRMNRELSTTVNIPAMVKFFDNETMISVGVTDRLCAEAFTLYTAKKAWSQRNKDAA